MKKKLRFLLLTALTMVCSIVLAQDPVTWDASSKDALPNISVNSDLTLTWIEAGGDQAPSYSTQSNKTVVYMRCGNKLTVAGADANVTITKIVFTYVGDNVGLSPSVGTSSNNLGDNTSTWTGEANSITFTASGKRYVKSISVTYTGSATPVVKVPELAITSVSGLNTTVALDGESGKTIAVYYANTGKAAAENAKLTLYVGDAANRVVDLGTIAAGASNKWKNITYDVTKIEKGEHEVYISLTADGVDAVNTDKTKVNFTKADPVPAFTISAPAVTVPYNAESYNVVATLKETNNVAANEVKVQLRKGFSDMLATTVLETVAANAETQVLLTVAKEQFETGTKTYYLYVNDKYLNTVDVTFEEAPVVETKDLVITAIDGTIDLANESSNVRVIVENKGNVDITDAPVTLMAGEKTLGTATVSARAGQQGFCYVAVASEGLTAGELAVKAIVAYDEGKSAELEATLTVKAAPVPAAKFELTAENVSTKVGEANFTVKVKVKNVGTAAGAAEVKLVKGTESLADALTTNSLEVNGEQELTFTVANPYTTAGTFDDIQALTTDGKAGCHVNVAVAAADVEPVVDIALVDISGISEISLKEGAVNTALVRFTNNSNFDVENATITLTMNGTQVGEPQAIVKGQASVSFTLPTEGLEIGQEVTLVATLNATGNKDGNTTEVTKTLPVVSGEVAPAPAFTVTAQKVEVLTTDQKVKVVVNVKNTGNAKADRVDVQLKKGTTPIGEPGYIWGLEAGADKNVTIEFNNFDKAGTYEMQAWATCGDVVAAGYFDIIVKAPVAKLAIESIEGTINLANTSSRVTVTVKNDGTANASNVPATLSYGETTLESTIQFIRAGEVGYAYFQVPSEGLTAGELNVTAKVEYEEKVVQQSATLTVQAAPVAQPTFSVTADNVTVPFGATSFEIKATIKNTSEVDAQGLTVKLLEGITEVETRTLDILLQAGNSTTETFTITATEDKPFVAGKTVIYYVQAGKAQTTVEVTFEKETVAEVKDLAIESIQGTINLGAETSNVTVTVKNNGNVDVTNAKVTLSYGETTLEKTVSIKAGQQGYAYFSVASAGITGETLAVTATVELEGDATSADNTKTENLTVRAADAPQPTFSIESNDVVVAYGDTWFEMFALVTNTSDIDATNVSVEWKKGTKSIGTSVIENLPAGRSETTSMRIEPIDQSAKVYYAQVGNAQAEIHVTYQTAPAEDKVDMALTAIQGLSQINLKKENKIQVWYKNNSNVVVDNASVEFKLNGEVKETKTITNIAVGASNYVEFTLPTEGLVAGQKATVEVNLAVEGDTNLDDNRLEKSYDIVSGEAEPMAEIMINPIRGWNVSAGEQQVTVNVSVFNQGDADAKDVKIELYKSYGDGLCAPQTVDIKKDGYQMLKFQFTYTFEEGKSYDFTVFTNYKDANLEDNMRTFTLTCPAPVADVAIAKIANIEATTEQEVKIAATLTNKSDFAAKNVKVGVYKLENYDYQLVGIMQTFEEIAANAQQDVEFKLGKLEAGNYTYYVRVVSVNGNTTSTYRDVNVKVTEPVVETVDVALTQIQGISNIDLASDGNIITVWMENKGNVAANASVAAMIGNTELEAKTTTVGAGKNANVSFTLPTDGLTAGTQVPVTVTLTVEGNTSEATTITRIYDVINSAVATEPVFEISAAPVEVEFGAEKFNVPVTVKNTSAVDAENVVVSLFYNETLASINIGSLAAGAETPVFFENVSNPFTRAGEYTMYVQAPKANCAVTVTVKPEPVVAKMEVALTAIQGISNIDLAEDATNTISVWAENSGNQDADAAISVTLNGTAVGEAQTLSLQAGRNGAVNFELPTTGLTAGTKATVVATVSVAGNTSEATTLTREYDIVNSAVATDPVYEVAAAPVEVEFGAEKFNVVATVTNTNNIAADNVTVNLFHNGVIATQTVSVAANATTTVTFNDVENPFTKAGTYTMYVQAPNAQAEVAITVKPEPVAETIDLAVTAIQGTLSLEVKNNYLTVFVENKGTVDAFNAPVKLIVTSGEDILEIESEVIVGAGRSSMLTFTVSSEFLNAGEASVTATVTAEGDIDETNNSFTQSYTIAPLQPTFELAVADVTGYKGDLTVDIPVTVKNTSKVDAENVEVGAYLDGSRLGYITIQKLEANSEANDVIKVATSYLQLGKNQLLIAVGNVTKWVNVTVVEGNGIAAIKAKHGDDVKVYTVGGQKVDNVKKGVYIVNGRTVVVK